MKGSLTEGKLRAGCGAVKNLDSNKSPTKGPPSPLPKKPIGPPSKLIKEWSCGDRYELLPPPSRCCKTCGLVIGLFGSFLQKIGIGHKCTKHDMKWKEYINQ